jgi:biotin transport system substrate-specific component
MSTVERTWRSWAEQEVVADPRARKALGALAFVLATTFGAYVEVKLPGTAVPITLQVLFVILSGAVLGSRAGAAAMASYVAIGAAGAPVFAGGAGGFAWLLGPTGGYLIAMPAAAWMVGLIAGRDEGWFRLAAGLIVGVATIYLGGLSQLFLLTRLDLGTLLSIGMLPFLAGDVAKILAAFLLTRSLRHTSLGR